MTRRPFNLATYGQDDWWAGRVGFRIDSILSPVDNLTVEGGYGYSNIEYPADQAFMTPPYNRQQQLNTLDRSSYLLGRWTGELSDTLGITLQGFLDLSRFDDEVT